MPASELGPEHQADGAQQQLRRQGQQVKQCGMRIQRVHCKSAWRSLLPPKRFGMNIMRAGC